jgi:4-amino-4-deoxy-L-arabinose transferase-like glycosyltransferase
VTPSSPTAGRLALALILAVYVALAAAYGSAIPLWEAPDAIWHYQFVAHLAAGGGLPIRADEGVNAPWRQQGSQPPLYYLAAAPLVALVQPVDGDTAIQENPHAVVGVADVAGNLNRMVHPRSERFPWHGTDLAARLVGLSGILWGLLAVLATWALARAVVPDRPAVALAAAALLAFNPEFVFISSAISNDVAVTATAALALWATAAVIRHGPTPRRLLILGAALGLATLSKLSGLWLLPLAAGGLIWVVVGGTRTPARVRRRQLVRSALYVTLPLVAIGGWWYLRNWLLFHDPTGLPLMLSVMTPRPAPPGLRELAAEAVGVWKSYWAVFGWFNVIAPTWVYGLATAIAGLGLAGLGLALARRRVPRAAWPGLILATAWVGLMVVALYLWARVRYPQGRLLFPAAPALALLVAAGWVLPISARAGRATAVALAMVLAGLCAWLLPAVILPAYAPLPGLPLTAQEPATIPPGDDLTFGGLVALRGVALPEMLGDSEAPISVRAGDRLVLDLHWQALARPDRNYSVFLHLVDEHGQVVGQADSYPGAGSRPMGDWMPGDTVVDTHVITVPDTAATPACDCQLTMGVYDSSSGRRLTLPYGRDEVPIARLFMEPSIDGFGDHLVAVPIYFGDDIVLMGYDLQRRALQRDRKLRLTLYWQALRTPPAYYRVSVQFGQAGETWSQTDSAPADDQRPTTTWQPGEVVVDTHVLRLPKDAPLGDSMLRLVLYDPRHGPLPVNFRDFEYSLGPVRISEPR